MKRGQISTTIHESSVGNKNRAEDLKFLKTYDMSEKELAIVLHGVEEANVSYTNYKIEESQNTIYSDKSLNVRKEISNVVCIDFNSKMASDMFGTVKINTVDYDSNHHDLSSFKYGSMLFDALSLCSSIDKDAEVYIDTRVDEKTFLSICSMFNAVIDAHRFEQSKLTNSVADDVFVKDDYVVVKNYADSKELHTVFGDFSSIVDLML